MILIHLIHVLLGYFSDTGSIIGLLPCQWCTVYPKKYAHGFVVLCFVVVMQSFIMNAHDVFIHIHQGCFAGTGAIIRLPQCQWSKPDGYGKISQCITTTKHSKAVTVCIFLGIYCSPEGCGPMHYVNPQGEIITGPLQSIFGQHQHCGWWWPNVLVPRH